MPVVFSRPRSSLSVKLGLKFVEVQLQKLVPDVELDDLVAPEGLAVLGLQPDGLPVLGVDRL